MKAIFVCCSICCFAAFYHWPIGYYTFLRIVISFGAISAIYHFLKDKNYTWIIAFAIILILFNPIFPIYLYRKSIWLPFDIVVGILFLLLSFGNKKEETPLDSPSNQKKYKRDLIISKNLTNKEKP